MRSRSPLDLLATLDAKPGSNNSAASGVSKPKRCRDYDGMYHTGFPMCITQALLCVSYGLYYVHIEALWGAYRRSEFYCINFQPIGLYSV